MERFNSTAISKWLNLRIFDSIERVQSLATEWVWIYNNERPHSAIGGIPPRKLLETIQTTEILFLTGVRNGRITKACFYFFVKLFDSQRRRQTINEGLYK